MVLLTLNEHTEGGWICKGTMWWFLEGWAVLSMYIDIKNTCYGAAAGVRAIGEETNEFMITVVPNIFELDIMNLACWGRGSMVHAIHLLYSISWWKVLVFILRTMGNGVESRSFKITRTKIRSNIIQSWMMRQRIVMKCCMIDETLPKFSIWRKIVLDYYEF